MKFYFVLSVLWATLVRAQERNCAENIVGLATRRQPPACVPWTEPVDRYMLREAENGKRQGNQVYSREIARERDITQRKNIVVQHGTPEMHHYLYDKNVPPFFAEYFNKSTRDLYQALGVGQTLARQYGIPSWLAGDILAHMKYPADPDSCLPNPRCNPSAKYRTYDGSCNNLKNPKWGMSGEPFTRLLPPVFDDGIYSSRTSVMGGAPLPSPRLMRTTFIQDRNFPDDVNLHSVMTWGQVVAHDTLGTNDSPCFGGAGCMCCKQNGQYLAEEDVSRACYVVDIPPRDYMYGPYNKRCMSFARGNATFALNCRLSAAENINNPTSYLDGSLIYGTSEAQARSLRELRAGRMNVSRNRNREMLPRSSDSYEDCDVPPNEPCYLAGDPRVNQNPLLTIYQTVLLRFHNDIARKLQQLNPSWQDEKLFQESRTILIAVIQHITYNEMVPIYLSRQESLFHDLLPLENGYNRGYNPDLNAQIINSHTGAAYRALHGIVQGNLALTDNARCPLSSTLLGNWFTKPRILTDQDSNFDNLLIGTVSQHSQKVDEYMTTQLTDNLFKRNGVWGQDLATLDIARGRERGLPCYNDYRELCGLRRAKYFHDITNKPDIIRNMEALYKHVDDVDLYVGGFLESPMPNSLFGPTFHCIVKEQMYRTKFGDRFFYEFPGVFNQAQLASIKKMTFSKLICNYGNSITQMQYRGFEKISERNPLVPCTSISNLDLRPWQESRK